MTYPSSDAQNPNDQTVNRGGGSECTVFGDGVSPCLMDGTRFERTTFDGFGRPVNVSREGVTVNTEYDAFGRVVFESHPNSSSGASSSYDVLGRTIKIEQPHTVGPAQVARNFTYLADNKVRTQNERGFDTTITYQAFGAPNQQYPTYIDILEESAFPIYSDGDILISRNEIGVVLYQEQSVLKLESSPPFGLDSQYAHHLNYFYNNRYQIVRINESGKFDILLDYDYNGNLKSRYIEPASLDITTYTYDAQNRLSNIDYPEDGGFSLDVDYEYDKNGNVEFVGNIFSSWNYTYNANDKLTQEELSVAGNAAPYSTIYNYDHLDNLESITYPSPSNLFLSYEPNDLGWPTQVSDYLNSVSYHSNGASKTLQFNNGTQLTTTLNNRQWIYERYTAYSNLLPEDIKLRYDYDEMGNVVDIIDSNPAAPNLTISNLTYDEIDRLITADGSWGIGRFSYSDLGDITYLRLGDSSVSNRYNNKYGYDPSSSLLVDTTHTNLNNNVQYKDSYGYDWWGNITRDGQWCYAYNHAQELRSVYNKSGPDTCGPPPSSVSLGRYGYAYDGNGQRIAKTEHAANGNILRSHIYVKGQSGLLVDEDSQNGTKEMIYLNGQLVAERHANGTKTFFYTDALGSPIVAADINGDVTWRETYQPYGKRHLEEAANNLDEHPLQYTGQPLDNETGLQYFGARYYNPDIGRFYAIDPVGFQSGNIHSFNRYAYASNNPYRFIDPDGREVINLSDDPEMQEALDRTRDNLATADIFREAHEHKKIITFRDWKDVPNETLRKLKVDTAATRPDHQGNARTKGKGTNSTIYLDPSPGHPVDTEEGFLSTPIEIVIAHELKHALNNANGVNASGVRNSAFNMTNEELNTRIFENTLRGKMGLPLRQHPVRGVIDTLFGRHTY